MKKMNEEKIAPVSSAHIISQLAALAATLARLENEAAGLSLGAVSGDATAADKLALINAKIEQARADRTVLKRARSAAIKIEMAASQDAEEARRQQHFGIAGELALNLVGLCERTDAIIEMFGTLTAEIDAIEKAIWENLRLAHRQPADAIKFRRGIILLAFENMANVRARGDFRSTPIAPRARVAWEFLLAGAESSPTTPQPSDEVSR